MGRVFAGFIGFILFIILLVVLLTHGHKPAPTPTGPNILPLPDYANTTAAVSYTTEGIVNGDDMHRQIRITIAQDRRVVEVIRGYSGEVIDSHTFYNTNAAYSVFLKSINNEGFLAKNTKSKAPTDEAGQCPLGFRYIFILNNEGEDLSRLWTSSCGTKTGTWGGILIPTQTLFQNQIPNYSSLTGNVSLQMTSL